MIIEYQIPMFVLWGFLIIIIFYETLMYLRGKSSESWKPYSASVAKLGIDVREDEDGTEESQPIILYEYTINKTLYKGKKIIYGDIWTTNYGDSCDDLMGIKVGSKITVYVNSKNFNMSVLKQGYRGNFYWKLFMLLTAVILVIIVQ